MRRVIHFTQLGDQQKSIRIADYRVSEGVDQPM